MSRAPLGITGSGTAMGNSGATKTVIIRDPEQQKAEKMEKEKEILRFAGEHGLNPEEVIILRAMLKNFLADQTAKKRFAGFNLKDGEIFTIPQKIASGKRKDLHDEGRDVSPAEQRLIDVNQDLLEAVEKVIGDDSIKKEIGGMFGKAASDAPITKERRDKIGQIFALMAKENCKPMAAGIVVDEEFLFAEMKKGCDKLSHFEEQLQDQNDAEDLKLLAKIYNRMDSAEDLEARTRKIIADIALGDSYQRGANFKEAALNLVTTYLIKDKEVGLKGVNQIADACVTKWSKGVFEAQGLNKGDKEFLIATANQFKEVIEEQKKEPREIPQGIIKAAKDMKDAKQEAIQQIAKREIPVAVAGPKPIDPRLHAAATAADHRIARETSMIQRARASIIQPAASAAPANKGVAAPLKPKTTEKDNQH